MVHIPDMMALFALFSVVLILKMIFLAATLRDTDPMSRLIVTQRRRYSWLLASGAVSIGLFIWLLTLGSFSDLQAGASEWMATSSAFGTIVGISTYMLLYGIWTGMAALTVIYAYRKPTAMAFKYIGGRFGFKQLFVTTASHRRGEAEWERVTPTLHRTRTGEYKRLFLAIDRDAAGIHRVLDSRGQRIGSLQQVDEQPVTFLAAR